MTIQQLRSHLLASDGRLCIDLHKINTLIEYNQPQDKEFRAILADTALNVVIQEMLLEEIKQKIEQFIMPSA